MSAAVMWLLSRGCRPNSIIGDLLQLQHGASSSLTSKVRRLIPCNCLRGDLHPLHKLHSCMGWEQHRPYCALSTLQHDSKY
jgi:hypothetical protein